MVWTVLAAEGNHEHYSVPTAEAWLSMLWRSRE